MSELRIKLIELAIQGGATIENAQRVAADWEEWIGNDDPLSLDTPSPAWRHESEMSPEEYWRLHSKMQGIDWSRPQLVHSTTDPTMIIRVDGDFTTHSFNGTMIDRGLGRTIYPTDASGTWDKSCFVYHGEIPQEQQAPEAAVTVEGAPNSDIVVSVWKSHLVKLYNFAYGLAVLMDEVEELHEIDALFNGPAGK